MGFSEELKERLKKPLDATLIKQRAGGNGMTLDYVEGHEVTNLLDDIFGPDRWNFDVKDTKTVPLADGKVKFEVVGTLAISDENGMVIVRRDGLGSACVSGNVNPETVEFQSKAAATDALKRAAVLYGNAFGRHLYDKDDPTRAANAAPGQTGGTGQGNVAAAKGNPYTRGYSNANGGQQPPPPQQGGPAAIAPDTGEVFNCEHEGCGEQIAGYQSGVKSKYRGQMVTAAQLVADSRRLHGGKAYCYKHYQAAFQN